MSNKTNIIPFPKHLAVAHQTRLPRQRVFYLGYHEYGAMPGAGWQTEYWVKRLKRGAAWEILCLEPCWGKERFSMGTHTPEEVREYFDSVEFWISHEDWRAMGWLDPEGAEIIQLK